MWFYKVTVYQTSFIVAVFKNLSSLVPAWIKISQCVLCAAVIALLLSFDFQLPLFDTIGLNFTIFCGEDGKTSFKQTKTESGGGNSSVLYKNNTGKISWW